MTSAIAGTEIRLTSAAEIGLSPKARLYVATGSPLLFRRTHKGAQLHFDASWLYIPSISACGSVEAIAQTITDVMLGQAIDLDDWLGYPIVAGQETLGVVVLPSDEKFELAPDQLVNLTGYMRPDIEGDQRARPPVSELFVRNLFRRESSPEQFTKRLLSLLSSEWNGSCAGAYIEHQGLYSLLLATGEVSRYYRLTRQLTLERASQFIAACEHGQPFQPAELLPEDATFLSSAPDLFFVHRGLKSERLTQYIAIAGPGDVSRRTARRLKEFAELVSLLDESQFHSALEITECFRSISRKFPDDAVLSGILQEAAGHLGRQMKISRVTIVWFTNERDGERVQVFLLHPINDTKIETRETIDLPASVLEKVRSGQAELIGDLTITGLTKEQARRRYLDNVVSEYCLPVETSRGVVGVVTFGSPAAGDYLTHALPLFTTVVDLISVWSALNDLAEMRESSDATPQDQTLAATARLGTIHRLAQGHLHALSESISATVGQAELVKEARSLDDPILEAQRQNAAVDTLCTVADRLDYHLSGLRHVFELTAAPDEFVDCSKALSAVPVVLAGLIQRVKDSKSLDLKIIINTESALRVSACDLYDRLLPLAIAIIEQSICSGGIRINGCGTAHTVSFTIRFPRRLLGGAELSRVLTDLFPSCELILTEGEAGQMILGETTLVFRSAESDEIVVTLDCVRRFSQEAGNSNQSVAAGKN